MQTEPKIRSTPPKSTEAQRINGTPEIHHQKFYTQNEAQQTKELKKKFIPSKKKFKLFDNLDFDLFKDVPDIGETDKRTKKKKKRSTKNLRKSKSGMIPSKNSILESTNNEPIFDGLGKTRLMDYTELPNKMRMYEDGMYYGDKKIDSYGEKKRSGDKYYGLFWYKSGALYIGDWVAGYPHGYGYLYHVNGAFYFGQIEAGLAHGYGLFTRTRSYDFYYLGDFRNGLMHGRGYVVHKGGFYKVTMNKGKIAFSEQTKLEKRKFKLPEEIKTKEDELDFMAYWMNPLLRKYAVMNKKNLEAEGKVPWNRKYYGQVKNGKKHGAGSILYSDGGRFHGMFYENKALGLGVAADCEGNFELGFYTKKSMEFFGDTSQG